MSECNENTCPYKEAIDELKRDSERNSAQHREFYEKFESNSMKIAISEERYANLLSLMTEVKTSLTELKEKPARQWENVIIYIITSLIGLAIGYFFKM